MRPTDILKNEHRVIEQVLDCLEQIADRCEQRGVLDIESAEAALRFLIHFADRCHHGKEEATLFAKIGERGIPTHVGPVAVMLQEHVEGRAHIQGMTEAIRRVRGGDRDALSAYVTRARGYVELLREHIMKEDHILFPMAEAALSDADRADVLAAFERVEHDDMGPGLHEEMVAIADRLATRFGVAAAASRTESAFHGCCHGKH